MSMSREEIDLREKISREIEAALPSDFAQAIGVVRKDIWHGRLCPCSQCQRFEIRTCESTCGNLTNTFPVGEYERLFDSMAHQKGTLYYCGYCNHGQNEWQLNQMLFDKDCEMAVTPCCHTEATEALKCYCAEEACEADDDSLAQQERLDYVWSQS